MRILLSAYACEPDKGSEPGVGWNWAVELARSGHTVFVITRSNNSANISKKLRHNPIRNLQFIYYDLPDWCKSWKKGNRGIHLYYFLWQIGIYFIAKNLCKKNKFDVIHHVTFVGIRQPSFLGFLGIPFVFGPVAGGESVPFRLRKSFPARGKLTDAVRDLVNQWVKFSPLMRLTFLKAIKIFVTSEQGKALIPQKFHTKTIVQLAIGSEEPPGKNIPVKKQEEKIRVLYVGQLLYLKGVHFALQAFSIFLKRYPDAKFTVVGKGPDERWLKDIAFNLGINSNIEWCGWLPKHKLDNVYQRHDIFLFPSLRDSGGMVLFEAMNNGLPVVCLDLGGPGTIVDASCGYCVPAVDCSEREVIERLGNCLLDFAGSPKKQKFLQKNAFKKAAQMSWKSLVESIYDYYPKGSEKISECS